MASGIDLDKLKSNYQKVQSWTNTLPGQTRMSYSEIKQTPVSVGTVKYSPVTYNGTEYKTQDAGALKQALAKQLRPTYDLQAAAARKNTNAQNAAIDADAASRGMGTSTWVTDVKNRNYNTLNDNLRAVEADYANTLYGNLLSRLSEQEARKLQNDQFNAGNRLNTDLSNAQGQYNADATNVSNKYTADVFNSTAAYQAALQNWQNQQAALQYNNELDQAALARNLELAQQLKRGGGGGKPKQNDYVYETILDDGSSQYRYGNVDELGNEHMASTQKATADAAKAGWQVQPTGYQLVDGHLVDKNGNRVKNSTISNTHVVDENGNRVVRK